MELKLKTRNKEYVVNHFDVELGVIEDLLNILDLDKMDDNVAIARMVLESMKQVKPILLQMFPGLTEDELRTVGVFSIVQVLKQAVLMAVEIITGMGGNV